MLNKPSTITIFGQKIPVIAIKATFAIFIILGISAFFMNDIFQLIVGYPISNNQMFGSKVIIIITLILQIIVCWIICFAWFSSYEKTHKAYEYQIKTLKAENDSQNSCLRSYGKTMFVKNQEIDKLKKEIKLLKKNNPRFTDDKKIQI